jgi:hypothetical protein
MTPFKESTLHSDLLRTDGLWSANRFMNSSDGSVRFSPTERQ